MSTGLLSTGQKKVFHFSEKKPPSTRLPSEMKEAIGKSLRSEEDIVSTCLLYVENPASTRLPSTDQKKLFQLSEKDGYHDSPTHFRRPC